MRNVPIHPEFLAELTKWKAMDNERQHEGHIVHYHGQGITKLDCAWATAKRKAGISGKRLRPYDLRHFFATSAIEAGSDYKTLSDIMGSNPETLRRYYQHVSDAARTNLIEHMPHLKMVR